MTSLRILCSAACLTLLLSFGALAGSTQAAQAHSATAPNTKVVPKGSCQSAVPVVKLGTAMQQERIALPDGSVQEETWTELGSAQPVKTLKTTVPVKDTPKA